MLKMERKYEKYMNRGEEWHVIERERNRQRKLACIYNKTHKDIERQREKELR